jgi:hypothetical protein
MKSATKLKHPTFPKISDEMKRWSALLAEEMKSWPDVRIGSMFGMNSMYRGKTIFALLPEKRGLEFPNAIAIKRNGLGKLADKTEKHKWQSIVIESDKDLNAVLKQLEDAYGKAKTASGKPR